MATFNASIAASSDDAFQDGTGVTPNLTNTAITINSTARRAGLRFTNVTIPNGAPISAATLTVNVSSASNDDPDIDIRGEAADNAATFAVTTDNISGRTTTTAIVQWTNTGVLAGPEASPDISTIISEIVGRGGWSSGNALVLILQGRSSNSFRFDTYDNGSGYATLEVTYTTGGGGGGMPVKAVYYANMRTQS